VSEIRLYRVSGVVLRQRDLGEADRLVRLFTPERGKLSAVAKGAKRPRSKLAASVQPFTHSRFQIAVGRSLDIVTQAQVIDPHYGLREDLARLAYANHLSELVDGFLQERQRNQRVFELYLAALRALAAGRPGELVARAFEVRFLALLGFGPGWGACASCSAELGEAAGALSPTMGLLCARCRPLDPEARPLSAEVARLAQAMAAGRGTELTSVPVGVRQQLASALRWLLEFHLDRPLRSARFIAALPDDREVAPGEQSADRSGAG
jgi:DNA repair protein RecO (recombination protein O)